MDRHLPRGPVRGPRTPADFRDRLRRTAQFLGYATLRAGLLVATTDRWEELISLLPPPPACSQLLRTGITLSAQDSSRVAAELWDLEALARRYRTVLTVAREHTERAAASPPAPAAALTALAAALLPVYEASADDPDLPAELLPADWPGDQIGITLNRAYRVFAPLLDEYLARLREHHPSA